MSWNALCAQAGCDLAERVAIDSHHFSDDELNGLLDDVGMDLCRMMLREGVPEPAIIKALDVMAAVFETRLIALEAMMPVAGHA